MKRKTLIDFGLYWIISFFFVILFGEVIGPLIAGNPLPILIYPIVMGFYYLVLSFVFAILISKFWWWVNLIIFFIYGFLVEWVLFKNVKGIMDWKGILFFGFFYVFLFGIPLLITKFISKKFIIR